MLINLKKNVFFPLKGSANSSVVTTLLSILKFKLFEMLSISFPKPQEVQRALGAGGSRFGSSHLVVSLKGLCHAILVSF